MRDLVPTDRTGDLRGLGEDPEGRNMFPYDDGRYTLTEEPVDEAGDAELIRKTIDLFVRGSVGDLERPTFERNRHILYEKPALPDHEFVRSNLNSMRHE